MGSCAWTPGPQLVALFWEVVECLDCEASMETRSLGTGLKVVPASGPACVLLDGPAAMGSYLPA